MRTFLPILLLVAFMATLGVLAATGSATLAMALVGVVIVTSLGAAPVVFSVITRRRETRPPEGPEARVIRLEHPGNPYRPPRTPDPDP